MEDFNQSGTLFKVIIQRNYNLKKLHDFDILFTKNMVNSSKNAIF